MYIIKSGQEWGVGLTQRVEHGTLDFGFVSLSPMLGVEKT